MNIFSGILAEVIVVIQAVVLVVGELRVLLVIGCIIFYFISTQLGFYLISLK